MHVFDKRWTLFLDRDGVINLEKKNGYVLSREEFHFEPGALDALRLLQTIFGRILVVTNQRCVGKGLISAQQLEQLHRWMCEEITNHGGRIDRIYYCPDLEDESPCRKPNIGMALQASRDFPDIDFQHAVMVGNHFSDMQFGKSLGMYTVLIASDNESLTLPHPLVDACFAGLWAWAQHLKSGT
ncbi:D-glycero-alpha-D-manno-heptose-1,7-bisphosphate 7-phosphatase [Thermoflavifilum thermophilum]|uniref:D,D-heptose 1,7-bisphosphate phosphatase n=1 Tax=Thermoflavifilum thermophilum TaxID=1393122 RepID=A0A1I7NKZ1_9BACT|nr:HAD family hydrolase [Thermoflavifilum thermophilum]SFV35354.1 D-glycero-D-manno-heptose 1,7-bisphosphate phosphatase [Thermoflavifilum thermophilum]